MFHGLYGIPKELPVINGGGWRARPSQRLKRHCLKNWLNLSKSE
jgi:hypothetical protein